MEGTSFAGISSKVQKGSSTLALTAPIVLAVKYLTGASYPTTNSIVSEGSLSVTSKTPSVISSQYAWGSKLSSPRTIHFTPLKIWSRRVIYSRSISFWKSTLREGNSQDSSTFRLSIFNISTKWSSSFIFPLSTLKSGGFLTSSGVLVMNSSRWTTTWTIQLVESVDSSNRVSFPSLWSTKNWSRNNPKVAPSIWTPKTKKKLPNCQPAKFDDG